MEITKRCECGAHNPVDAKYCHECGIEIEKHSKYAGISLLGFACLFLELASIPMLILLIVVAWDRLFEINEFLIYYIVFQLLTIGIGVYLYTRPEKFAIKRGKFILTFLAAYFAIILIIILISQIW
ncbi:MAG: hypothetical protein HVN34_03915 [Methanobacteriaceae archaeon]|nr:hypothetical protein [Methanobacteriaceae archaeon]